MDINSTQETILRGRESDSLYQDKISGEKEMLLSPGHFCIPEQIIRNEKGFVIIGSQTNAAIKTG